jgi:hypothetical protein
MAIAQAAGSRNPAAPRSTNSGQQLPPDAAPVGHRQPRTDATLLKIVQCFLRNEYTPSANYPYNILKIQQKF